MPAMEKGQRDINKRHLAFGKRIRFLRLKGGFSQEDLAELCELDRTYIGGIERGERNPSLKNILRLADALGVSPTILFEGSDDPEEES